MSSRQSRRRILTGIAVSAPAIWSTPIIESVVLPAHAQSSPSDSTNESETGTDCGGPLTINDVSITCTGREGSQTRLGVDDEQTCPQLVMDPANSFAGDELAITAYASGDAGDPGNTVAIRVNNTAAGGIEFSGGVRCDTGNQTSTTGSLPVTFSASSGATWRIDGNLVVGSDSVTLESISITPV